MNFYKTSDFIIGIGGFLLCPLTELQARRTAAIVRLAGIVETVQHPASVSIQPLNVG